MQHPFFQTIDSLRRKEELMLFTKTMEIGAEEEVLVAELLAFEYEKESLNFPFSAPAFTADAALWGARTVYFASQLLLYREQPGTEIPLLLPEYNKPPTAAAMFSADLCLRFLPPLLQQAFAINPEDALVSVLENHLQQWHYSAIGYDLPLEKLNFEEVLKNQCLLQLYADRIIDRKALKLAEQAPVKEQIKASLGHYASTFWSALS
ncbi:hypothetical protein [Rufibacter sp. LB8]|uniref:hypothetical protein n=1 Tax=Rufibacter sp. LB8 TaxID=2777781 RepID=UPI00178C6E36|nr:hypothetical protein [Rufibacter sp. LB8]